jgi:hypothetical protein
MELPEDFNQPSKHSFCVLPWLHRFVNLGGEVQLCCTAETHPDGHIRSDSGSPIHAADGFSDLQIGETKHMRAIRTAMLNGEWPAACERCMVTEQAGGNSRRCYENQHFKQHIPWILENTDSEGKSPVNIRSRDFRPGNLCNLRCRMCHPRASNLMLEEWNEICKPEQKISRAEAKKLSHMDWYKSDGLWRDFAANVNDLEHLHFAGGEPLVIPEVIRAMEICIEAGASKRVELTFNTNATGIPRRHRELWPHFKAVNLLCSVDAHGALNDYIRHPSKWSVIANRLDLIDREHEALNLGWASISATVQIYNIFHLPELIEYSHQRFGFIQRMPNLVHLSWPDYFNIQNLPAVFRNFAAARLQDCRDRLESGGVTEHLNQIDGIIAYMSLNTQNEGVMEDFKRVTNRFDQLRGESLASLVPELSPLV